MAAAADSVCGRCAQAMHNPTGDPTRLCQACIKATAPYDFTASALRSAAALRAMQARNAGIEALRDIGDNLIAACGGIAVVITTQTREV